MIVYVESNFLLEIALQQEEAKAADDILGIAETGGLDLAFPAFILSETLHRVVGHGKARKRLIEDLQNQSIQFDRARAGESLIASLKSTVEGLAAIEGYQMQGWRRTARRMLEVGRPIETRSKDLENAATAEVLFRFSPGDAILSSVVASDIQRQDTTIPTSFLTRDREFERNMREHVLPNSCKSFSSFVLACQFLTRPQR